jgi:hypothetical protein
MPTKNIATQDKFPGSSKEELLALVVLQLFDGVDFLTDAQNETLSRLSAKNTKEKAGHDGAMIMEGTILLDGNPVARFFEGGFIEDPSIDFCSEQAESDFNSAFNAAEWSRILDEHIEDRPSSLTESFMGILIRGGEVRKLLTAQYLFNTAQQLDELGIEYDGSKIFPNLGELPIDATTCRWVVHCHVRTFVR